MDQRTDPQIDHKIDTDRFRVAPGTEVELVDWDTEGKKTTELTKADALELLPVLNRRLAELQQLLYAESKHKVLVVLQGMDTSGKDGTIKHVFATINPMGVRAVNFKPPNDVEAAHDYLWRVHHNTPVTGQIMILNRSHYEDVLVVRVHELVPQARWERRYGHIADFERMLIDEGTVVRKFFLHISKDQQRKRLQERIDNPAKNWKFEHGDINERKLWDEYQRAYERALGTTSTTDAPWYIVPADHKWFRNLLVSRVLIETLEGLDMQYPESTVDLSAVRLDG